MSAEDPTFEEVWREFHNFTFQTLPNLERLKGTLKKAADAEQFIASSAAVVAQKQEHIDFMASEEAKQQKALDDVRALVDKTKSDGQKLVAQYADELLAVEKKISDARTALNDARTSMQNELSTLSKQRDELQSKCDNLTAQIASQTNELENIRARITAANAALK